MKKSILEFQQAMLITVQYFWSVSSKNKILLQKAILSAFYSKHKELKLYYICYLAS